MAWITHPPTCLLQLPISIRRPCRSADDVGEDDGFPTPSSKQPFREIWNSQLLCYSITTSVTSPVAYVAECSLIGQMFRLHDSTTLTGYWDALWTAAHSRSNVSQNSLLRVLEEKKQKGNSMVCYKSHLTVVQ